jgi:hypothetical protein
MLSDSEARQVRLITGPLLRSAASGGRGRRPRGGRGAAEPRRGAAELLEREANERRQILGHDRLGLYPMSAERPCDHTR